MIWVPRHRGISANETDVLAKWGAGTPFAGHTPAYSIPSGDIWSFTGNG